MDENITTVAPTTTANDAAIKSEVNTQIHKHLSTVFVVVGIISFTLGAIVNWYTIKRLRGGNL